MVARKNNDAPPPPAKVDELANANLSDARRTTIKHVRNVREEVHTLEEPKANARIVAIATMMAEPSHLRLTDIEDKQRAAHINQRIDDLMAIPFIKKIVLTIAKDPQGGCIKDDVEWIRSTVFNVLQEIRAIRVNVDLAPTNISLEQWDQIVAKSMAPEELIDEKGLKTISEGAVLSWGSRNIEGHKHVSKMINDKAKTPADSAPSTTTPSTTTKTEEKKPDSKTAPTKATARTTPGAECTYCKKIGHTREQCYLKERDDDRERDRKKRERSRSPRRDTYRRDEPRDTRRARSPSPARGRTPPRRNDGSKLKREKS